MSDNTSTEDRGFCFFLTRDQSKTAANWTVNHSCTITYSGAMGGKTTFSFSNTNLGQVAKVSCACGASEDLTDYDEW